jgi:hypothetical protein
MTIRISARHIMTAQHCPIETALRASGYPDAYVMSDLLFLTATRWYFLTPEVRQWIADSDRLKAVMPFDLELREFPATARIHREGMVERLVKLFVR